MLFGRAITFVNAMLAGVPSPTTLRVAGGRILAVGAPPFRGDRQIDCQGDWLLPGLINAHDHLELNNFGRLKWRERYENVREWIADFRPRFGVDPALTGPLSVPLADRLYIGGLKNLFSGVTTVAHHNPLYPPLRRPDFPVRVVRCGWSHSLLLDGEAKVRSSYRRTPAGRPWIIHLAEGIDAEAAGELARLDALGCLRANTLIVHGVGLTPADRALLLARGAGVIWCPASNDFLFGATADVTDLAARGRVALGSDSRLSGARDLLDELRAARAVLGSDARLSGEPTLRDEVRACNSIGVLPPPALLPLVTSAAARMLRLPGLGVLRPGALADLLILPAGPMPFGPDSALGPSRADDPGSFGSALAPNQSCDPGPMPFGPDSALGPSRAAGLASLASAPAPHASRGLVPVRVPDLSRAAVLLVMRAGRALYADPCYASAFTTPAAARIIIDGAEKLLERSLYRERAIREELGDSGVSS